MTLFHRHQSRQPPPTEKQLYTNGQQVNQKKGQTDSRREYGQSDTQHEYTQESYALLVATLL
jgi:hypothetical protein